MVQCTNEMIAVLQTLFQSIERMHQFKVAYRQYSEHGNDHHTTKNVCHVRLSLHERAAIKHTCI